MGTNFFTAWVDGTTQYIQADMNAPLNSLDQALVHLKNVIVSCDGVISYAPATGTLSWSNTLRIHFNADNGNAVQNTVATGNVVLADNQFAYVDLNDTNNTVLTVSAAAITTGAASNFKAQNRLVLGYRNTTSDNFYPVALKEAFGAAGSGTFLSLTDTPTSYAGNALKDVRVNSGEAALEYYSSPYDVGGSFIGTPNANDVILRYPFPRAVVFPASLTGSQGVCVTGPTAQTDFDLQKGGVSFGTMRFAISATTATFISASGASFAAGNILTVVAPAALNGIEHLGWSLAGTR